MRFGAQALLEKGVAAQDIRVSLERNMQCGIGWCGHCQLGRCCSAATARSSGMTCRSAVRSKGVVDGPGGRAEQPGNVPSLAVWKFASCDGCQLTLLDCEDELLTLAEQVQIAAFAEASSAIVGGPYDVSLVEVRSPHRQMSAGSRRFGLSPGFWWLSGHAPPPVVSRLCVISPMSPSSLLWSMPGRITSRPWPPPRRPRRTSPSTMNCGVPDRPWPVAGHPGRVARRSQAQAAGGDGVHRVQTVRGDVRGRGRGYRLSGSGHPRRL